MSCACEIERGLARPGAARRRRSNVAVLGVALTCAAGCVPSVTHAPQVEPGPALEYAGGFETPKQAAIPIYPPFVLSPANFAIAYGWRADSSDFAARFGGGLSMLLQLEADAYVQLPRRRLFGLDGGFGVSAQLPSLASTSPMPYVELGAIRSGSGPYVIAGYVHQPSGTSINGPEVLHSDGWETTLAYQLVEDRNRWRPFATAVIGRRVATSCVGPLGSC